MPAYSPEIEQTMQKYYATLSEKDQRRYAAIEALKLPRAEQSYIAKLFGCSLKTYLLNKLGEWYVGQAF